MSPQPCRRPFFIISRLLSSDWPLFLIKFYVSFHLCHSQQTLVDSQFFERFSPEECKTGAHILFQGSITSIIICRWQIMAFSWVSHTWSTYCEIQQRCTTITTIIQNLRFSSTFREFFAIHAITHAEIHSGTPRVVLAFWSCCIIKRHAYVCILCLAMTAKNANHKPTAINRMERTSQIHTLSSFDLRSQTVIFTFLFATLLQSTNH